MRYREIYNRYIPIILSFSVFFQFSLIGNLVLFDVFLLVILLLTLFTSVKSLVYAVVFSIIAILLMNSSPILERISWVAQYSYALITIPMVYYYLFRHDANDIFVRYFVHSSFVFNLVLIFSYVYMITSGIDTFLFFSVHSGRLFTDVLIPNDIPILVVFALVLMLLRLKDYSVVYVVFYFASSVALVFMLLSRSGILSLFLGIALCLFTLKGKYKLYFFSVASFLFFMLVFAVVYYFEELSGLVPQISRLVQSANSSSNSERVDFIVNAINYFEKSLIYLDFGLGNSFDAQPPSSSVHNYFLSLVVNLGWFGVTMLFFVMFFLLSRVKNKHWAAYKLAYISVIPSFMLNALMLSRGINLIFMIPFSFWFCQWVGSSNLVVKQQRIT